MELFSVFMEGSVSPFLKIVTIILFIWGAFYIVVKVAWFILSLIFDYKYKKKIKDLDEYVDFSNYK